MPKYCVIVEVRYVVEADNKSMAKSKAMKTVNLPSVSNVRLIDHKCKRRRIKLVEQGMDFS